MMRPPRMGVLRSFNRVISAGESLSSSHVIPAGKEPGPGGEVRPLRVPSPTYAGAVALAEWEAVGVDEEGEEGREGSVVDERWVFGFGQVPSSEEVQAAVLSLQQMSIHSSFYGDHEDKNLEEIMEEQESVSIPRSNRSEISTGSESDWIEPTFHACNQLNSSSHSSSKDRQKVLEAFRLLQTSPSIQKMVVSLSSDEAVWDAVMKNEAVQEMRKSLEEGISEGKKTKKNEGPFENLGAALSRIFGNTRTKLMEFFRNINNIVNEIFHRSESEERDDERMSSFAEAVRSSLMLSVVVFLIIMVTRVKPNSST